MYQGGSGIPRKNDAHAALFPHSAPIGSLKMKIIYKINGGYF
jgi:hypothetical protein